MAIWRSDLNEESAASSTPIHRSIATNEMAPALTRGRNRSGRQSARSAFVLTPPFRPAKGGTLSAPLGMGEAIAARVSQQIGGERQQSLLHFEALKRLLDRDEPGWAKAR